jgi:ABC-type sugar transport system ATPase subunit
VDVPERLRRPLLLQNVQGFTLGIRPMHLHPVTNGAAGGTNQCSGSVYVYERLGTKGVLTATVGEQKIDVITPIEMDFAIDAPVRLGIETNHIMVFNRQTEQNILFAERG